MLFHLLFQPNKSNHMDYVLLPIPSSLFVPALMLPLVQRIWFPVVIAAYHSPDLWFGSLPGSGKIRAFKMSILEDYNSPQSFQDFGNVPEGRCLPL